MYLNILLACVVVGVVHVEGGCVEDPFKIRGFMNDKESRDLKDVELISKDLKFKLDHGLNEKEFMEMMLKAVRHHFLSKYQNAEKGIPYPPMIPKVDEKNDHLIKALHGMIGIHPKKEIPEEELKAVVAFLKSLSAAKDSELHLKKDNTAIHKENPQARFDEELLKAVEENNKKISEEKFKDFETHLAESLFRMQTDKDAKADPHGDKEALEILKKLGDKKPSQTDGSIPYFLIGEDAHAYFKPMLEQGKAAKSDAEGQSKISAEQDTLIKLFSLIKDSLHLQSNEKEIPKDTKIAEDIPKQFGSMKTERSVEDMKSLAPHAVHLKEGMITHEKDLIFDELLKKEEFHPIGDDKELLHGIEETLKEEKFKKLSPEEQIKLLLASGEKASIKPIRDEKAKKDEEVLKTEKDKSVEDILKEEGYYITKGTDAYEKAVKQAHEDSKVALAEESKKKVGVSAVDHAYDPKFLDEAKDVFHGTKTVSEGTLKSIAAVDKEKGFSAHGEDGWKIHGSEIAKDEDKFAFGSGIGLGEDKFKDPHMTAVGADKDIIEVEKTHSKGHGLKNKFLGALGRVLNMKKCHLVTMRPGELLGIIDCISRSKDPMLCEKFSMCEKKKPLQVILAYEKCQKETIPGEEKRCSKYEPLYPSRDIPLKIFKCVAKNIHELSPIEKKQMIDFEECVRQVKIESCGRIPWG
ncbi:hypothetical protein JTE90_013729 [Oedothorax gibbosus]|uniref:Uncharacterized protein n=1 Tax=Oedothorax gibbosus TaxID=931172 RepID=A0AAV6UXH0_9ARAC|nr:hypothetical protein JTE90_013729 [Oedothorax gibbosus]